MPKKSASPPKTKRVSAAVSPEPPSGRPFLRFYHPAALRKKTLTVLAAVETSPDPTQHRKALAELVVDLTRCGMDTYFLEPLKLSRAGFLTEQSANLGMAGAVRVLSSVIQGIIGGMGAAQLRSVCGSIRTFMQ
jgi:hypothetical protein